MEANSILQTSWDVKKDPKDTGGKHQSRVNSTLGHMPRRHRGMARKRFPGESKNSWAQYYQ